MGGENAAWAIDDGPVQGLIPAWAGKTAGPGRSASRPGAHPRVGGENMAMASSSSTMRGSSPRGRGKPSVRLRKCTPRGLIPGWAGKTTAARLCPKNDRAHPRVGGENSSHALATSSASGSSPRGRGKRRRHRRRGGARGLIPAWAGKTAIVSLISKPASAHPRVGGENRLGVATRISKQGSSPRGRGKRMQ